MRHLDSLRYTTPRNRRFAYILAGLIGLLVVGLSLEQSSLLGSRSEWLSWRSKGSKYTDSLQWPSVGEEHSVKVDGRIVITGGGGNIGKRLIRRLLSTHNSITVVDLIFHQDELDSIHEDFPDADLNVVYGDIRDETVLAKVLTRDVTGIIHLAAVSRVGWCLENEPDCADVNVRGTDVLIKAMEKKQIQAWFVQASSREVYGNAETFPVSEDARQIPANAYGRTKSDAETVIQGHDIRAILLRLSNVYGSPMDHRERLIPAIVSSALSHRTIQMVGGNQDLDMVHIDDVINAFILAVNRLRAGKVDSVESYNVGTGTSASAMDIIRKVLALTNSSSPLQIIPGDARFPDHYIGTTTKAADVLGFKAQVGVDQGLVRLVGAFYQQTISFIERQIDESCSESMTYSARDIGRLDGCTGTVGVDGPSGIEYLALGDSEGSTPTFEWVDTDEPHVWTFHVDYAAGEDQALISMSRKDGDKTVSFEAREKGRLFGAQNRFIAKVEPHTGYVSLFISKKKPVVPGHMTDLKRTPRFRLTPHCCPRKATPWPFFDEDPLASAISDDRIGTVRYFNASQTATRCERLHRARNLAATRLTALGKRPDVKAGNALSLEQASLPSGQPFQWRMRNLDHCTNLCDHPTVCLDTGDCACGSSACVPRLRYPFTAYANVTGLSYPPPTINWDEVETNDPTILIRKIAQSSWLNVLRPHARRYFQSNPSWPTIHLTSLPTEIQTNRDVNYGDFNKLQSTPHGCFSADSVLERGVKALSQDYEANSIVFMPYFAGTQMMPPVEPWIENALTNNLPKDFDSTNLIVPFTFDWGVCNTVLHNLFRVRDWSSVNVMMERITAWQPMGDLNSPCYRIDQDVVIPSRTCLQDRLRERFGDLTQVKPSRMRSVLVFFKGSPNGAGSGLRRKLACPRTDPEPGRLLGGEQMRRYWNEYKPGADYIETIADSVFCPLPAGTTGWATRTIDVIYAGCIPVLFGDQTQHPYWDMLDWTKFSITIPESQVYRIEEILLSYTWLDIQHVQTNLVLVRDAFLYPSEPDMTPNLHMRGPFFFAMHNTAMLRLTKYPVVSP